MKLRASLILLALLGGSVVADPLSQLDRFVSCSHFIAVVNITSEPKITGNPGIFFGESIPRAFAEYEFDVDILEPLHGSGPGRTNLTVHLVRPKLEHTEELPQLRKGAKCIVFLDSPAHGTFWGGTADGFFSLQPYSKGMALWIRRLSEAKAKQRGSR